MTSVRWVELGVNVLSEITPIQKSQHHRTTACLLSDEESTFTCDGGEKKGERKHKRERALEGEEEKERGMGYMRHGHQCQNCFHGERGPARSGRGNGREWWEIGWVKAKYNDIYI